MAEPPSHANKIKAGNVVDACNFIFVLLSGCALATSTCFAWGLRAAWKQAKPLKPNELTNANLMGGVGFASRALGIATILTISGFSLLILGVSAALNVNTPKQVRTSD